MSALVWRDIHLPGVYLEGMQLRGGERVHLVMPRRDQFAFLELLFGGPGAEGEAAWRLWMETREASYQAGTPEFLQRLGSLLHRCGLVANLSLEENLLLPFLYRGEEEALARAQRELADVAIFLGIEGRLAEQAGERSAYTHAVISLGRCMLMHPDFVVTQEVHVGLPPERMVHFRQLLIDGLDRMRCGLIYLSATEYEGSGIDFDRVATPPRRGGGA